MRHAFQDGERSWAKHQAERVGSVPVNGVLLRRLEFWSQSDGNVSQSNCQSTYSRELATSTVSQASHLLIQTLCLTQFWKMDLER